MNADQLDQTVLRFPCYEPSGLELDLSVRDLLRHMLLIGQTGSGKTTLLNRIISDIVHFQGVDGNKMGMLILDSQSDGTVQRVVHMAKEADRLGDVCILSPSQGHFDPFAEIASFADLDLATSTMVSASKSAQTSGDNPYWAETTRLLLETALIVLLTVDGKLSLIGVIEFCNDIYLSDKWAAAAESKIESFREIVKKSKVSLGIAVKLRLSLTTILGWKTLEARTRSILQTCLVAALAPFTSNQVLPYFDSGRGSFINPQDALKGKIIVVCTHGSSEPEAAGLISKLAKISFYRAAQSQTSIQGPRAALIMDELPLAVTSGSSRWSDVTNLATLRGKGVAVIAATQGLVNLDLVVDPTSAQAMLANFSSVILLRSQECGKLSTFAEKVLGTKTSHFLCPNDAGDLIVHRFKVLSETICPEGALARLEPHQAYVSLANGYRSYTPVWLAPLFLEAEVPEAALNHDPDFAAITRARNVKSLLSQHKLPLDLWHILKERPRRAVSTIWLSEFKYLLAGACATRNLTEDDLASIPICWRRACLRLAKKLPKHIGLEHLSCQDGLLSVEFACTKSSQEHDRLVRTWRGSVYPSRNRQPNRSDSRWLAKHFPHLA